MLSVELLPAAHGDSIWIEYGSGSGDVRRILIDGGPAHTYASALRRRIAAVPQAERALELMVVSHIDADHIDGALILLRELAALHLRVGEIWFNAWKQLPKTEREVYAPLQGEFLGGVIADDKALRNAWNRRFKNGAVMVPQDELPAVPLAGGAKLTLVGPTHADLRRLRARWASAIRDFSAGDTKEALRRLAERREYRPPATPAVFAAKSYGDDRSPANGSSISFVFEHQGVSILFAADSHARTLAASLERLARQRGVAKLRFDAVKLPHHGSMGNVSAAWLQWVDCDRWLISTNGAVFDHPDVEAVELIAEHSPKPTVLCNYKSPTTQRLVDRASGRWTTVFADSGAAAADAGPVGGLRLTWAGQAAAKQASRKQAPRKIARKKARP